MCYGTSRLSDTMQSLVELASAFEPILKPVCERERNPALRHGRGRTFARGRVGPGAKPCAAAFWNHRCASGQFFKTPRPGRL
jgi:hypothetical protein